MKRGSLFTLVEIMIVVAIIGLLAAIAVPGFMKARGTSQKHICIEALRITDGAVQQWAMEKSKVDGDAVTEDDLTPYLKNDTMPTCPRGGKILVTVVGTDPTCPNVATLPGHRLP